MKNKVIVAVQKIDFDLNLEMESLKAKTKKAGAVVFFVGKVRDLEDDKLQYLEIESFEELAKSQIKEICKNAADRWDLEYILVKHRFGRLKLNDNIVLVVTSSKHRKNAYDASVYIMEYLKSNVPFWKKEVANKTQNWVENP
ncbi:MAG: molybdenum cofactor biosynthesis protein MoaE [Pseudomonadota bacterium]|jgi:molybdopterin synthase catalytic subunit|nr:molybdenum cofactor biosynthesis protein MoaE [Pseudomonadota bacterium]|tara:strand:- start:248 stop:673 length:426 start_codon:yes stop_codon:yes gene_type:complete